jgi:hypothetical protein
LKEYGHNNTIIVLINDGSKRGGATVVKGELGWISWLFNMCEELSLLYGKKKDIKVGLDKLHELIDAGLVDIVRMTPNKSMLWSKDGSKTVKITKEEKEYLKSLDSKGNPITGGTE